MMALTGARAAVRGAGDAVGQQRLAAARRGRAGAGLRRQADGVAGGAAGAGCCSRPWRSRARAGGARRSCWPARRCTWWWRSRGCWGRSPSRPTSGPFAVGSSNGSAWNAALVFNGLDRLEGKPTPGQSTSTADPARHPPALGTTLASARASANGRSRSGLPRPGRLLDRAGPLSGDKLGPARAGRAAARPAGARLRAARAPPRRRPAGTAPPPAEAAQAAVGARGAGAVDGAGRGPLQPDGPPASALHREHHARGGGDARDRARVGLRAPHPRAPGRARGLPDRPSRSTSSGCCSGPRRCGGW